MSRTADTWILAAQCPSRLGTVDVVTRFLKEQYCYITELNSFDDRQGGRFFIRAEFRPEVEGFHGETFHEAFVSRAAEFGMEYELTPPGKRTGTVILVSKADHCLNDLLYRYRIGQLPLDIRAVISNHPDLEPLAAWHGLPYYRLQTRGNMGRDHDRIDSLRRHRAMAAATVDGDAQGCGSGHRLAGDMAHRAGQGRHVMLAEHDIRAGETFVEAIIEHRPGAAEDFLGRLANQHRGSAPVLPEVRQHCSGPHQAATVQVMAAGVHHWHRLAFRCLGNLSTGKRQSGLFLDGQGIHIATQNYRWAFAVAQQGPTPVRLTPRVTS